MVTRKIKLAEVENVNLDNFIKNDFLLPSEIVEKIKTFHQAQQKILELNNALHPFKLTKIEKEDVISVETTATKVVRERLGISRIVVTYAAAVIYNYYFQTKVGDDFKWVKYTPCYKKACYTELEELDFLEDVDQYIEENEEEFKLIKNYKKVKSYDDMNTEWRLNRVNFLDNNQVAKIVELAENFFVLEKTKDWIFENEVIETHFPKNPLPTYQND